MKRRCFLAWSRHALLAFLGALYAWPVLSFLTWRRERFKTVQFTPEEQSDHYCKDGVILIKGATGMEALSATCTHLGCTVVYDEQRQEFRCPCHRSAFSSCGARLRGPAQEGLHALEVKRLDHGGLEVRSPV